MIPVIGPKDVAASCGSALVIAATTFSASGSISSFHAGSVFSTQSTRDHAAVRSMPEGSSVTWSSHRSASRRASATAVCSAWDVGWWPDRELADRALPGEVPVDRAAGPVHQLLQLREQRHLAEHVLGGSAAGDAAEQGAEAERVGRVRLVPVLAALGITVGQPETEGHVTHASTVDG